MRPDVDVVGMASRNDMLGDEVAEPFRSDERFWRSVSASADAVAALVLAVAAALTIELTAGGAWCAVPFAVPTVFLVRAGRAGRASAHQSQASFGSEAEWRNAEREAVAQVFFRVLLRRRWRSGNRSAANVSG
ncbi:MAG: hypothetical protein ACJ735_01025 [Actinomycetes bacterium]